MDLEENLPLPSEQLQPVIGMLLEQYYKEPESSIRAKIAHLLGELCKSPGINAVGVVDDISNLLKSESKHMQHRLIFLNSGFFNNFLV